MNIKRIMLLTGVIMIAIASLSIASAGWFDSDVEADTFKFAPVDGFSDNNADMKNGVQLVSDDKGLLNTITVREIDKKEYKTIEDAESPASLFVDMSVNGEEVTGGDDYFEVLKNYDEGGVKIVVEKMLSDHQYTTAIFEKDGSYYCVQIMDSDSPDKDIQIVKNIYDSLEKL